MKKLLVVFIFCSFQSVSQTLLSPSTPTGLTFPNLTANMVVDLLKGIMNHAIAEIKKAEQKKIKLATIIEENFEEDL
jgi:hypothetical protein